jgi:hypothetical protein
MGKTLTVELPDAVYEALAKSATKAGTTPSALAAAQLTAPTEPPASNASQPPMDVHPEILTFLRRAATRRGINLEAAILEWKAEVGPQPSSFTSATQRQADLERLLRHAGTIDSRDPQASANDRIDADLAREYGGTLQE